MKYINIADLKLAYTEVNETQSCTLFFVHGNSASSQTWHNQLSDPKLSSYRLIAFDLPAHGQSAVSAKPDDYYSVTGMGKLLAAAVIELVLNKPFILVGVSLGTSVVAEMLPYLQPSGLVLLGCNVLGAKHTMQQAFQPGLDSSVLFTDTATPESIDKFATDTTFFYMPADTDRIVSDYHLVKPGFRPTLLKTFMEGKISDEIDLLETLYIPVLVIFGEHDKFCNINYLDDIPFRTWENNIYKIPRAGHYVHLDQPEIFTITLLTYANEVFNS